MVWNWIARLLARTGEVATPVPTLGRHPQAPRPASAGGAAADLPPEN